MNIEYWYVSREAHLLSELGVEIADRLDAAILRAEHSEAAELVRHLVRVSSRLSHILWPIGSWATSPDGRRVAAAIRNELGISDGDPLGPARIVSYTAVAPMTSSELRQAVDLDRGILRLEVKEYPIEPLISSLRAIHRATRAQRSLVEAA